MEILCSNAEPTESNTRIDDGCLSWKRGVVGFTDSPLDGVDSMLGSSKGG